MQTKAPSASTAQGRMAEMGESLGRSFRPPIPPHVPLSSPASSFLSDLLLFSHRQSPSAFAPISFLSLQVTNFMNQGRSAKYRTIYLSGEGSDRLLSFPTRPTSPVTFQYELCLGSDLAFLVYVLRKDEKPRIRLRTCSIDENTIDEKTPLRSELIF